MLCIIQARSGSTRWPKKCLHEIEGRPMWKWVYDTAENLLDRPPIMAIPQGDLFMMESCLKHGVEVIAGPENDVLMRYVLAVGAFGHQYEWVMRLTGDCPFIPPYVIKAAKERGAFRSFNGENYIITTAHPENRTYPDGWDVEIFTRAALIRAHHEATKQEDREHVTSYMYNSPDFRVIELNLPIDLSHIKCSIDTKEDLERWKPGMTEPKQ